MFLFNWLMEVKGNDNVLFFFLQYILIILQT